MLRPCGYDMPIVGLGTYSLHGSTCINSVKSALERASVVNDTNPGMFWHKIGGAVAVEPDEIK